MASYSSFLPANQALEGYKYIESQIAIRIVMGFKEAPRKLRYAAARKERRAPRWADIKKFGLKRARSRRISSRGRNWRRDKLRL